MSFTAPRDLDFMQNCQLAQVLQLDRFSLFYQPPKDDNFYHVTLSLTDTKTLL